MTMAISSRRAVLLQSQRQLTQTEVTKFGIYSAWPFNGNVADIMGNGHFVTVHNVTTQTESVAPFVSGKPKKALFLPSGAPHGVTYGRSTNASTAFTVASGHPIMVCGWANWASLATNNIILGHQGNWILMTNASGDLIFGLTHDGSTYFGPMIISGAITLNTWNFVAAYCDGTNFGVSINGGPWTSGAFGPPASPAPPSTCELYLGGTRQGGAPFNGLLSSLVFCIDPPSMSVGLADQFKAFFYNSGAGVDLNTYRTYTGPIFFCEGDSTTAGTGSNAGTDVLGGNYPDRLLVKRNAPVYNFGVTAQTLLDMNTDAATTIDVFHRQVSGNIVLVIFGGINDINTFGATGAIAYSRLITYAQARAAGGWSKANLFVCNLPYGTSTDAERLNYVAAIAGNGNADWNNFVDFSGQSPMGAAGDSAYRSDAVHPNSQGYEVLATQVATIVAAAGF